VTFYTKANPIDSYKLHGTYVFPYVWMLEHDEWMTPIYFAVIMLKVKVTMGLNMYYMTYFVYIVLIVRSGSALYGECSYIEEKAVYILNIDGKTVQWKTREQYCSIIMYQPVLNEITCYRGSTFFITLSFL